VCFGVSSEKNNDKKTYKYADLKSSAYEQTGISAIDVVPGYNSADFFTAPVLFCSTDRKQTTTVMER
jgi:hypothetical protein